MFNRNTYLCTLESRWNLGPITSNTAKHGKACINWKESFVRPSCEELKSVTSFLGTGKRNRLDVTYMTPKFQDPQNAKCTLIYSRMLPGAYQVVVHPLRESGYLKNAQICQARKLEKLLGGKCRVYIQRGNVVKRTRLKSCGIGIKRRPRIWDFLVIGQEIYHDGLAASQHL